MHEEQFDDVDGVAEYLRENKDEIALSLDRTVAMTWDNVAEDVIVVRGDFRGDEDQVNAELKRLLSAQNN